MDSVGVNADGNDAPKDKSRSFSTLNTLYHETQQEIELLNKQLNLKDNIIADLKARLGRYENLYLTVGDQESVMIGPSKSLLESLCKEICKLKQRRNDLEFKTSRQEEVDVWVFVLVDVCFIHMLQHLLQHDENPNVFLDYFLTFLFIFLKKVLEIVAKAE